VGEGVDGVRDELVTGQAPALFQKWLERISWEPRLQVPDLRAPLVSRLSPPATTP
jgi:hypothetical protein